MPKSQPTIYDVAASAGVSISTVSRVLNAPERVQEETRATVMAAIERLGFVPRADARARAMRGMQRIGVLTPFFSAPSFVQRLRGVAQALSKTTYELVIYTINSTQQLHTTLEMITLSRNLDGLIILSLQFSDRYARSLVEHGIEAVLVEYPHKILSSVEIDDVAGGRMAAEYLAGKGHRKIGFVGDTVVPEFGIHPITQRLSGLRKGLQDLGLPLDDDHILLAPYDVHATRSAARTYLMQENRPTAVFAATDLQAIGMIQAARDVGLRVPQDLAVMGFDNLDMADYFGLTTIDQQLDESGREAAGLLLAQISKENRSFRHVTLPLKIIERETT